MKRMLSLPRQGSNIPKQANCNSRALRTHRPSKAHHTSCESKVHKRVTCRAQSSPATHGDKILETASEFLRCPRFARRAPHGSETAVLATSRCLTGRVWSAMTVTIAGTERIALHAVPEGHRTHSPSTMSYFGAHVLVLPSSKRSNDRIQANTGRLVSRSKSAFLSKFDRACLVRGSPFNSRRDFVPTKNFPSGRRSGGSPASLAGTAPSSDGKCARSGRSRYPRLPSS